MWEFWILLLCFALLALIFYRRWKLLGEGEVCDECPEPVQEPAEEKIPDVPEKKVENPETVCKIGISYLRDNLHHKAEEVFQQLCLACPDNAAYFSNLGLALYSQQKLEEALKMYMRAIKLDPSRPGRFISIAQVCRELGRIEEAISHTRRALEIEARNVSYLLLLAELCKACDQHEQAREAVTLILEIDPDNKDAGEIY